MPGAVRRCSLSDCGHRGHAEARQAEGCATESTTQKRCEASQLGPGAPGSAALAAMCHDSIKSDSPAAALLLSQRGNKLYQKKHLCQRC